MGIDRIGKGGGVPPSPDGAGSTGGAGGVGSKTGAEKSFEVDRTRSARATNAADATNEAAATSPLARLRAGEINVDQYVDLKVDEATKPIQGVGSVELGEIKSILREQLRNDPALVDLVKTATGKMPTPSED